MRWLCVILVLTFLAGCAHRRQARGDRLHGSACEQLGYRAGSLDWGDCTDRLERARVARRSSVEMDTADGKLMPCDLTQRPSVCGEKALEKKPAAQ